MIVLFQPPGAWGLPSLSPFCLKLEAYLRMTGTPFEVKAPNMMTAPKGKVPYVSLDGEILGDSQLVIEKLEARAGQGLDGAFSAEERARAHLVRRMLEEGTYFAIVYLRWMTADGWTAQRPAFLSALPGGIGPFVLPFVRRKMRQVSMLQGTGRHSQDEIMAMTIADLASLSTVLGEHEYLLGNRPCTVDATVLAFLWSIDAFPVPSPVRDFLRSRPNLVAYLSRHRGRWFAA